jgi:hypothetical protein
MIPVQHHPAVLTPVPLRYPVKQKSSEEKRNLPRIQNTKILTTHRTPLILPDGLTVRIFIGPAVAERYNSARYRIDFETG